MTRSSTLRDLRVFIASPSDVSVERDIVSQTVVPEVRRTFADEHTPSTSRLSNVEAIRWETHTWPDIGEDAQDVINKQIGDFDIFIGVMWKRFGTLTKRGGSGTDEEFERAYHFFKTYNKPHVMFYFRAEPFYSESITEFSQFRKVLKFQKKLERRGVYFFRYDTPLTFERQIREHLIRRILLSHKETTKSHPIEKKAKRKVVSFSSGRSGRSLRIFLAYAREDLERVRHIYSLLRTAGHEPWLDVENLLPGQLWANEISKAVSSADVVLVFLSRSSDDKQRSYLNMEIRFALERLELPENSSYVIPVRLDPVDVHHEELRYVQWVDWFEEDGQEKLLKALDRVARVRKASPNQPARADV